MRITPVLWGRPSTGIPRRTSKAEFMKMAGLSDKQWPIFRAISLNVCKDYSGTSYCQLQTTDRHTMVARIKHALQEQGLPNLNNEAIEWRISKCLPELRVKQRAHDEERNWAAQQKSLIKRFPPGLLRSAVTRHLALLNTAQLQSWSQIPVDMRVELAAEANRQLAERNMPMVDEKIMQYRLRKCVNNWILRRVEWLGVR